MRTDVPIDPVPFERRVESPLWESLTPLTADQRARRDGAKVCSNCHKLKALDAFHAQRGNVADRASRCKACMCKTPDGKRRPWTFTETHQRCAQCHQWKPLEDFTPAPSQPSGRFGYCRPCHAERRRKAYALQRDERKRAA